MDTFIWARSAPPLAPSPLCQPQLRSPLSWGPSLLLKPADCWELSVGSFAVAWTGHWTDVLLPQSWPPVLSGTCHVGRVRREGQPGGDTEPWQVPSQPASQGPMGFCRSPDASPAHLDLQSCLVSSPGPTEKQEKDRAQVPPCAFCGGGGLAPIPLSCRRARAHGLQTGLRWEEPNDLCAPGAPQAIPSPWSMLNLWLGAM